MVRNNQLFKRENNNEILEWGAKKNLANSLEPQRK